MFLILNDSNSRVCDQMLPMQGLNEATNHKAERDRLEEQAELEAAMREKEQRTLSTTGVVTPVQIGSDPVMRRVKILLLGDSNVGKTSIISRLTTGDFKHTLAQTVGVDYKAMKMHIDGEMLTVQLWDTAGQEKFHMITTSYYRGVNGIMLCFDVSSRESFERVSQWMAGIRKHASKDVHVLLVGNKTDLRDGVTGEALEQFVTSKEVKPIASK
jgi:small GTP-binding protein